MKKISKIFVSIALVLVLMIPILFAGCDFFGGDTKTISEILIVGEIKTDYLLNENFDANGAKVKIIYEDETTKEIGLDKGMTNFNTTTVGQKDLTVTYKGQTKTLSYRVDAIKMAKFYSYYSGNVASYSVAEETKDENYYMQFNADGTGEIITPSSQQFTWVYQSNTQINLTAVSSGNVMEITIVNSKLIKITDSNNNLYVYRAD